MLSAVETLQQQIKDEVAQLPGCLTAEWKNKVMLEVTATAREVGEIRKFVHERLNKNPDSRGFLYIVFAPR